MHALSRLSRFALLAATAALLIATPALAEHRSRVLVDTLAYDAPSSTATMVNNVFGGSNVRVVECDRGIRFCFVRLPGPDGWIRASTLQYPVQPSIDCGLPLCNRK